MKKWIGLLGLLILTASIGPAQVRYERIRGAVQEPENWLTYSGSYASWRYIVWTRSMPATHHD